MSTGAFSTCVGCEYEGRSMCNMPCLACTFGSHYKKANSGLTHMVKLDQSVFKTAPVTNIMKTIIDDYERRHNVRYGIEKVNKLEIKNVIFNDPATIVYWADGTKTVVKTQGDELFDPEKGLAMAICKKAYGNESSYFNVIKKWVKKYEPKSLYPAYMLRLSHIKLPEELRTRMQKAIKEVLNGVYGSKTKPGEE